MKGSIFSLMKAASLAVCLLGISGGDELEGKPNKDKPIRGLADVRLANEGMTVMYGSSLVQQLQERGAFEAYVQASSGGKKLQFRSMAYAGDQVGFRIRASQFGEHMAYLVDQWTADRVVMAFGGGESFAGQSGVESFKRELGSYLEIIKDRHVGAELVLVSPIAVERVSSLKQGDLQKRNADLALYTKVMAEMAKDNGVAFIDLYRATVESFSKSDGVFTVDGMHLSEAGAFFVGRILAQKLSGNGLGKGLEKREGFSNLMKLVSRKAKEVFQAYHPTNGVHYYGVRGRTHEYFPEIPHHLKLANELDAAIWVQAQNLGTVVPMPELEVLEVQGKSSEPKRGLGVVKSSAEDLKDFVMGEGYEVNCFASSEDFPELVNPLQIQFDARGRLWVTSCASYPLSVPGQLSDDKILIYEDTDGDGQADQQTVFAEGLTLPDGFVFYKEGILISVNYKILYLEDRDGDGRADYEEEILRGADNTDTHHSGYLARTVRGDLMISEGLFHRGQFETAEGVVHTKDACMMSLDLDRRTLTVERQTEQPNPWRITTNRWGEDVQFYGGGQTLDVDLFNFWTPMGITIPGTMSKMFRYDKGCSAQFVESPHFPEDWQGGLLTCHLLSTNEINYTPMKYEDGGYRAAGGKFTLMKSKNKVFRPTDVSFALDGSLYVSDFYYPIIGHAQHSTRDKNRDKANGRIWRVTRKGADLVEVPEMEGKSAHELVDLLKHPLLKVRQVVRVELEKLPREEVAAVVKELLPLVKGDDFFALEVLWLLERLDEYGETAFYKKLLKSENMQVQRAAVRSLRWWVGALGEEARGIVARLTKHEDVRLKILLVGALSHLQREDETWGMFLGQIQAKPNGTLSAALMVAGWKDQPGIASEFPLLKVDKAANISHEQWLTKGDGVQKQLGELYFLSEEAGELVIGHKRTPFMGIWTNDTPLLVPSGSVHTKSSQNSFEVKRGLNKLGVSLRASRRTTGARLKFSVYLSDKKGSFPDGVSYAQSEEQHKQWRAEYKKEQEANWRDFAVATFKRSCANCHEVDKKAIGPGLKGLMGKNQTVIYADGSEKEVVVDEDYLRQAIVDPMSVYPKGYHPMMAKLPLSEKEVDVLVRWIKEME